MFRAIRRSSQMIALGAAALLLFAEQAQAQNPYGGVGYRPRDYYSARANPDLTSGYYPNDYYRQSMRYQAPAYYYDSVPYYGPRVSYYGGPAYGPSIANQ